MNLSENIIAATKGSCMSVSIRIDCTTK